MNKPKVGPFLAKSFVQHSPHIVTNQWVEESPDRSIFDQQKSPVPVSNMGILGSSLHVIRDKRKTLQGTKVAKELKGSAIIPKVAEEYNDWMINLLLIIKIWVSACYLFLTDTVTAPHFWAQMTTLHFPPVCCLTSAPATCASSSPGCYTLIVVDCSSSPG